MILSEQDLDFLKQLKAAGERGRTVQASNIRVALDRLAKGGFVVACPTGRELVTYRIAQPGRDALVECDLNYVPPALALSVTLATAVGG